MKKLLIIAFLLIGNLLFAQEGYKVGDKVSDFSLKNIDETMVSLKSIANAKGVILIFTCNHCPYAKLYEERIVTIDKQFKEKGYPVVAVNPNDTKKQPEDSFDKMKERAKDKGFTFPYLIDETQEVAKAFGATKTPHVYILQKKGSDFVLKYIGAIDDNPQSADDVDEKYVEDAVNALLKGQNPPKNNTRAIGCTIKWK